MNEFTKQELWEFVCESNKIEGITRPPRADEIEVSEWFLGLGAVIAVDLVKFVDVIAPGACLRTKSGGPGIKPDLDRILQKVPVWHPYRIHLEYETLHPFTDGNGRSGRILWAHTMLRRGIWPGIHLGFLWAFYYQALENSQIRLSPPATIGDPPIAE